LGGEINKLRGKSPSTGRRRLGSPERTEFLDEMEFPEEAEVPEKRAVPEGYGVARRI
jgi:hypothetical protein